MNIRKFKADRIFTGSEFLSGNFVLTATEEGEIKGWEEFDETDEQVEKYEGIICPGFINAHCHLELSHMKELIPKKTGLVPFLMDVVGKRNFSNELILESMKSAENEMYEDGIVAVGDICNTHQSIAIKKQSKIQWSNFVEMISYREENFSEESKRYLEVLNAFRDAEKTISSNHFISSLVPHAPYTVGAHAFEFINGQTKGQIVSCHNQESAEEDKLFQTAKGRFRDLLSKFGSEESPFPITGKTSLTSWLPHFDAGQKIILVHNTFTSPGDVDFALAHAKNHLSGLFFCICANANMYIENQMPPIEMLMSKGVELVLGTDGYSSNDQLSIAAEIRTIRNNLPSIPLDSILCWATLNGAKALGREQDLGSFEKGKKPGIILLNQYLEAQRIL